MATGPDAQVIPSRFPSRFVHVKRKPIAAEQIAAPCLGEESPVGDQILKAQLPLVFAMARHVCLSEAAVGLFG